MAEHKKEELSDHDKKLMASVEKYPGYELHGPMGVPTFYIQYKGVWDMEGLMKMLTDFFTKEKFKFYERMQRHRHPGPFGVERLYRFDAERNLDEYCKWTVSITMETFDEHDVEVVQKDGSRKKMAKGRLWIQLSGAIVIDYENRWETSWWNISLRKFMNRYIIRKRIELPYWDTFYYTIHVKLHQLITNYLKMETKGPEPYFMGGVH